MEIKKYGIILISIFMLVFTSVSVSAVNDPSGDVYHQIVSGSGFRYELSGERDNVDITDISYTTSGSDVTLSLTVEGSITDSENYHYWGYLKKNDDSYYQMWYYEGSGLISAGGDFGGYFDMEPTFDISNGGKTLSYTFTDIEPEVVYEPWGYAAEYVDYSGGEGGEAWIDYAPGSYAPWYSPGDDDDDTGDDDDTAGDDDTTGDDDDDDDGGGNNGSPQPGTPGFETVALLAALAVAFLLLRRKH